MLRVFASVISPWAALDTPLGDWGLPHQGSEKERPGEFSGSRLAGSQIDILGLLPNPLDCFFPEASLPLSLALPLFSLSSQVPGRDEPPTGLVLPERLFAESAGRVFSVGILGRGCIFHFFCFQQLLHA